MCRTNHQEDKGIGDNANRNADNGSLLFRRAASLDRRNADEKGAAITATRLTMTTIKINVQPVSVLPKKTINHFSFSKTHKTATSAD